MKRLDLVVGTSGSGKSTFVALTLAPLLRGSPFVNADEIARVRRPDDSAHDVGHATGIAAGTCAALIRRGHSFIAEGTASPQADLELIAAAHGAGYVVILHVLLIPEGLRMARARCGSGIDDRAEPTEDTWHLFAEAITHSDQACVYDSSHRSGPRIVADFNWGLPVGNPMWPSWVPKPLVEWWPR